MNAGGEAVELGPVTTSCDCLSVSLSRSTLEPGAEVPGAFILDLSREPDFRGGLMLSAEASVPGKPGVRAFAARLTADVR